MSKGVKALVQQNRKVLFAHLICLGVLLLGFVLCRYAFFALHGMKEWPVDLFILGVASLLVSLFARKQYVPWFTAIGYFLGFWGGVLFHTEGTDQGGGKIDNLWVIWTVVFLMCILAGILFEVVMKWWKLVKVMKIVTG